MTEFSYCHSHPWATNPCRVCKPPRIKQPQFVAADCEFKRGDVVKVSAHLHRTERWGRVVSARGYPIVYVNLWSNELDRFVYGTHGYHKNFLMLDPTKGATS